MGFDGLHQEPVAALWNAMPLFSHVVEAFWQVYDPWLMKMPQDAKIFAIILLDKSTGEYKPHWEYVLITISQGTPT